MTEASEFLNRFSFHDGQYLGHFADIETCVMEFRNWQENVFRFVFTGVALVRSYCGTSSLCEATIRTESDLIDECRSVLAADWGSSGGPKDVKLTELTITDDVPLFSVVFTEVEIIGPIDEADRMSTPV